MPSAVLIFFLAISCQQGVVFTEGDDLSLSECFKRVNSQLTKNKESML